MGSSTSAARPARRTITRSGCGFTIAPASRARSAGRRSGDGCRRRAAPSIARGASAARSARRCEPFGLAGERLPVATGEYAHGRLFLRPQARVTQRTTHYESSNTGPTEGGYAADQLGQDASRHPGGDGGGGHDAGGAGFERDDPRPIRPRAGRAAAVQGGRPVEFLSGQAAARRAPAQLARPAAKHRRAASADCRGAQGCRRATAGPARASPRRRR